MLKDRSLFFTTTVLQGVPHWNFPCDGLGVTFEDHSLFFTASALQDRHLGLAIDGHVTSHDYAWSKSTI